MKIDNKGNESDLEYEFIEMHVDLEAKGLSKSKDLSEYWSKINTAIMYPKIRATAEPFLHAFSTSYKAETGFHHVTTILTKPRNRLYLQNRGEL